MFFNQSCKLVYFLSGKSVIFGQRDRFKPKLTFEVISFDMNVRRFIWLPAVEMKGQKKGSLRKNVNFGAEKGVAS